ncbi:Endo-1,3(4)-beta-glucanase 1 [Neolecta irregularis DAH-3]|uniref:glucan endo-1,3-beta-D-glucosidase n=1 Tax=Neolecta irregularis (strain DAH-3) TaxID=1198029 RepID=A0A1U7LJ81_NEOID|nr:Endo-1,3(4)-beta-glucanase 1 [Neolecta irregularis DAH-3]|eukprot:OLL22612.1 Endo-1,3(4)-beta-glucanase 1 [Neolecta irregularis DAH-3]
MHLMHLLVLVVLLCSNVVIGSSTDCPTPYPNDRIYPPPARHHYEDLNQHLDPQNLVKRGSEGQDISSLIASQNQVLTRVSGSKLPITAAVPKTATSLVTPKVSVHETILSSSIIRQSLASPSSVLVRSTINTKLPTAGVETAAPVVTVTATSVLAISASVNTETQTLANSAPSPIGLAAIGSSNIFTPISQGAPNSHQFPSKQNFYKPLGLSGADISKPIGTNKFYENLLTGDGTNPVFSLPYALWWTPQTNSSPAGINIEHYDTNQYYYGRITGNIAGYYGSPLGVVSFRFGASEFSSGTAMYVDTPTTMSINMNVRISLSRMTCSIVQGMAFITFNYYSATPKIYTQVQVSTVSRSSGPGNSLKFQILLLDGKTWVMYVYPNLQVSQSAFNLQIVDNANLVASSRFTGYIQIAKVPSGSSPGAFDSYSGIYATRVTLAGSVSGSSGSYSFQYSTAGGRAGATLLTYLLPHLVASLSRGSLTSLKLASQTRGMMTGCGGSMLTFTEKNLPWNVGFLPYSASGRSPSWSASEIQKITSAANIEAALDMSAQSNLNSIYFAGKILQKFAYVCLTANSIIVNHALMNSCLNSLKSAISRFVNNQEINPLAYDTVWKGVVSTAGLTDGSFQDFGNAVYNDHHFHYGYIVHTAAIIGFLDNSWATANKNWVNTLIRDVANPSTADSYFPQFRSFDWFAGHSWSAGITAVPDGRNEESSSEGINTPATSHTNTPRL